MTMMIEAIEKNLLRGIKLLQCITNEAYSDKSVAPYYSSIGGHTRHILDVFDCVFDGIPSNHINLISRKRNELVENDTNFGITYFQETIKQLKQINPKNYHEIIKVTDDLGLGPVTVEYTLIGILIQAHSHAIHHFASVGYVIAQLGIQLPDEDFGFNPTTPKQKIKE